MQSNRSFALGAIILILAMLAACKDDGFVLNVRVATGLVPGPEFSLVTTELIENRAPFDSARLLRNVETMTAYGHNFARGYDVASLEGLEAGEHTIRVRLWRPEGTILIEKRMRIRMSGDYVVTVALTRDCVDVVCPAPAGSAAFSECLAGRCVSPECDPPNASEACGDVVFCNDSASCGATSSCAAPNCYLGVCHPETIDDACDATQWCDPDLGQGCVPLPIRDGGVTLDADTSDAGVDGGAVACGRACTPEIDPCSGGYWDCSGATPSCARLGQRPVGTLCGEDRACNAEGECVPCRSGGACRIGCASGTVSCAAGIEQCVLAIPVALAPPLTSCARGTLCVGDDACGSGDVCSSTGECVACTDGDVCNEGCSLGTINCATGSCTLDGSYLAAGAYCAPASYCSTEHVCGACVEHASCIPSLACFEGELAGCDTLPVCAITAATSPTTACAAGVCSGAGACVNGLQGVQVAPGGGHNCVLRADGSAVCFGDNTYGALATGDTMTVPLTTRAPLVVGDHETIDSLASGYSFSCAVTAGGELWCWGYGFGGVFSPSEPVSTPVLLMLPGLAQQVVLGFSDACVLLRDGEVWCSGYTYPGAGATGDLAFVHIEGVHGVTKLASSYSSVCALLDTGRIKCWGNDDVGQLGDGRTMTTMVSDPVDVAIIDDAIDISIADSHGCAVRADHSLWCWGGGGAAVQQAPVDASGGALPHALTLPFVGTDGVETANLRTCALASDGQVWCWGGNDNGEAGVGSADATITVPTPVVGLDRATGLARLSVSNTGCAIQDGYVVCWGGNFGGEIGDNTSIPRRTPVTAEEPSS